MQNFAAYSKLPDESSKTVNGNDPRNPKVQGYLAEELSFALLLGLREVQAPLTKLRLGHIQDFGKPRRRTALEPFELT